MAAVSEDPIVTSCRDFGLDLDAVESDNILILKNFLEFHGRSSNLTASVSSEALNEHIVEALALTQLARNLGIRGRWLDVGSGGGFPGLILAATLDVDFTLVEPRAKRAAVLERGLRKVGRGDCRVLRGRVDRGRWVEIEGGPLEGGFDAASARAVFSPSEWVEQARPWLRGGGHVFVNLPREAACPPGIREVGRVEVGRWAALGGVFHVEQS